MTQPGQPPDATQTRAASLLAQTATVDPTRARLVAAAAEVFAERGYDGAGVQEIARRAGLTTGAIYANFRGKADLLLDAVREQGTNELDELILLDPPPTSSIDLLTQLGRRLVTEPETDKRSLLFEAFAAARRDREVRDLLMAHLGSLGDIFAIFFERAQERGEIADDVDIQTTVRFCHSLALGVVLFDAIGEPVPDADAWTDLIARIAHSFAPDHEFQSRQTKEQGAIQ